jgi:hypothetical protein
MGSRLTVTVSSRNHLVMGRRNTSRQPAWASQDGGPFLLVRVARGRTSVSDSWDERDEIPRAFHSAGRGCFMPSPTVKARRSPTWRATWFI